MAEHREVVHGNDRGDARSQRAVVRRAMQHVVAPERGKTDWVPPQLAREHRRSTRLAERDRLDIEPLTEISDVARSPGTGQT